MRLPLFSFLLVTAATAPAADTTRFDPATATNAVGLDLYRQLAAGQSVGNLVISPYSIESALALAYVGADGGTRAEMARALHFPDDDTPVETGFASLRSGLEKVAAESRTRAERNRQWGGSNDVIEWRAANRLFGQRGYAFRETFLARMQSGFAAPFEALDFRTTPEPARDKINTWVEEQTKHRIEKLIPRGGLNAATRLVLVNALYLKAPWERPFRPQATQSEPFHLADGTMASVPTMRDTAYSGYSSEDGLTLVALDYVGGGLRFLIILPPAGESPDAAAARLKPEHFARWAKLGAGGKPVYVDLHLPKFRVKGGSLGLGEALRALGMKAAFDRPSGNANFDRIAPRKPDDYLAIAEVFHQTFIALDEEGTEAAAATAVVMMTLGAATAPPPPVEVRVDRPFLFAIQHRDSGACLFLGRINDPR